MKTKIFLNILIILMLTSSIAGVAGINISLKRNAKELNTNIQEFTHTIFCEQGSATWCPYCPMASDALYKIYSSSQYPFYYVSLVYDKNEKARDRLLNDYNLKGFPTCFFDGGYKVVVSGSENDLENAIKDCLNRNNMRDINLELNAIWKGNAVINISISIRNNEDKEYNGFLRVYITEISSRWKDHSGEPYHFGFLGFAINETISIQGGKKLTKNVTWDGNEKKLWRY